MLALFVASQTKTLGFPPSCHACVTALSILAKVKEASVPVKSATSDPSPVPNEMSEGEASPFVIHVTKVADLRGSEPDLATLRSPTIFSMSLRSSSPFNTDCIALSFALPALSTLSNVPEIAKSFPAI